MKTIQYLLICLPFTIAISAWSQSTLFHFQGTAQLEDGSTVKDREIGVQIEILEGHSRALVYGESHRVMTSPNGIFSLQVGNGENQRNSINNINWSSAEHYISLSIDTDGGSNYHYLGESPLSAVPYAFYGRDEDADPENELQRIYAKVRGPRTVDLFLTQSKDSVRLIFPAGGGGGGPSQDLMGVKRAGKVDPLGFTDLTLTGSVAPAVSVDSDPDNEYQFLDAVKRTDIVTQNIVTELKLIDAFGNVQSEIIDDTDFNNEIQQPILTLTETPHGIDGDLNLTKLPGEAPVRLPDLDPFNELQDLQYENGLLTIENGNEVEIPVPALSLSGNRLSINGGNSISLPVPSLSFEEGVLSILGGNSVEIPFGGFWEAINPLSILYDGYVSITKQLSVDGPGYFNNLTSLNNVFSQIFRTPSGILTATDEYIKLGQNFMVDQDGKLFAKELVAEIKNFVMEHPEDPSKEIYYVSLEGPEAAAYERGISTLSNGECFVPYSRHFQLVVGSNTPTIQLTPHSSDTYGLAIVEKRANGFLVKELKQGRGSFAFDWEVKAVRDGYENYKVIRQK